MVFYALGLKAQQSIHRLEPSAFIRATREARMDRSWENTPLDLSIQVESMTTPTSRGHICRRTDLICPHTVTVLIECLSRGTEDAHTGDFHPLRSAHVRHSNCDSEYRSGIRSTAYGHKHCAGRDLILCRATKAKASRSRE
jgi:hypothetical protein